MQTNAIFNLQDTCAFLKRDLKLFLMKFEIDYY